MITRLYDHQNLKRLLEEVIAYLQFHDLNFEILLTLSKPITIYKDNLNFFVPEENYCFFQYGNENT